MTSVGHEGVKPPLLGVRRYVGRAMAPRVGSGVIGACLRTTGTRRGCLASTGVEPSFSVVPAEGLLPGGLGSLADHAEQEGIRIVSTLLERWRDGSERYQQPGEAILAATSSGEAVGIGALSQCPHVGNALRVRRFYVAPTWRRQGVASALATELIAAGFESTDVITCNARASAAAAPFWESLGFVPASAEGITHVRRR
ncbi:MAG TPA: GNAT family N-acetyltransferase [Acidimicrobiales bacterium]